MRQDEMRHALLEQAMKSGFVTFGDLDDAFPAEFFPLDELDRFLSLLDELGIRVVEYDGRRKIRTGFRSAA